METTRRTRILSVLAAVAFAATAMIAGYRNIGLPPVVIVGGSSIIALVFWSRTYLRRPLPPDVILPLFLLTVAALEAHMAEEYLTGFGPAMSRLFDISWTERSFLIVFAFIGPTLYSLTALGLYYRIPLAGFLAWFIFIGPGVAEFTHFIFPLLRPAIRPELSETVSQAVSNGRFVPNMPELLPEDHRGLLLPRVVHRHPSDDPGDLGHPASGPSQPSRSGTALALPHLVRSRSGN
jgi:predicted NBD/HSP70 family sugar kinase